MKLYVGNKIIYKINNVCVGFLQNKYLYKYILYIYVTYNILYVASM